MSDFLDFYRAFYAPVRAFFRRRGGSTEDAEDLTQETFLRIYKNMDGYRDQDRPAGWIFTIAKNVHLQELRARRAEKRQGEEVSLGGPLPIDPPAPEASPEERAAGREKEEQIRRRIQELPEDRRHCLALHLQGLRRREIAEVLGMPDETVKSHVSRARKALRAYLEDPPPRTRARAEPEEVSTRE